jgi:hypothetical protein
MIESVHEIYIRTSDKSPRYTVEICPCTIDGVKKPELVIEQGDDPHFLLGFIGGYIGLLTEDD